MSEIKSNNESSELPFAELSYCPYGSLNRHSPYVETPIGTVRKVAQFANLKKDDIVIDIGCGAGDFLNALINEIDGCKGYGVDIEPELIKSANNVALTMGIAERVEYKVCDFFKDDISWICKKATHIYLYLTPRQLHDIRFKEILINIANRNIPIISYSFDINYLKLVKFDEKFNLYLYSAIDQ